MRARLRSYGETSTRTRSPGRMRIRNRRILPATCPSTSWPLSSCTRNMAFGSASTTSPSNSTFSSFAKAAILISARGLRPAALAVALVAPAGVRRRLWRGLVGVRVEALVVAALVVAAALVGRLVAAGVLGLLGRLGRGDRRRSGARRVGDVVLGALPPGGGVLAEEGLRLERRLGRL